VHQRILIRVNADYSPPIEYAAPRPGTLQGRRPQGRLRLRGRLVAIAGVKALDAATFKLVPQT
jgi:hypothetical protein